MHVLALLCLGLVGNKDRAAIIVSGHQISAHAATGSTGTSRSGEMVAALAKSELDLDAFVDSFTRAKAKSKSNSKGDVEEDEDNNEDEEEAPDQEEVEEDEEEDESDEKESSSQIEESSKAAGSPPAADHTQLIGRDKKGMFKNHKNFVRLRNKINEQESGHQHMFDSINEKL